MFHEPTNLTSTSSAVLHQSQRDAFSPCLSWFDAFSSFSWWDSGGIKDSVCCSAGLRPNAKSSQANAVQLASEQCSCFPVVCGLVDDSSLLTDPRALLLVSSFHHLPFVSHVKVLWCSCEGPQQRSSPYCLRKTAQPASFCSSCSCAAWQTTRTGQRHPSTQQEEFTLFCLKQFATALFSTGGPELLNTSDFLSAAQLLLTEMIHCSGK